MSRRIDVELTSARDDGGWTWRAAGAKQPKGSVDASLVPTGVKVGDVLRAEAEFDLDGVVIVALAPVQEKKRNEPERIEVLGRPVREEQLVTSTLTSKPKRERRDRGDRERPRDGERDGDRTRDRRDRRPPADRDRGPARTGGGDRGRDRDRQSTGDGERTPDRSAARPRGDRRPPRSRPEEPAKPRPKRLRPGRVHRSALLETLPPEHRPIAEQVLEGDIPAVRHAIDKENEARTAKGEPTINGTELLALAEKLRPRLRTAEWRDRADAAIADLEQLDLRDLRSVVVAAESAARDDETRALASQLREALTRRVEHEQSAWLAELTQALDDGRVVRALRLSSRPPKAGTILPAEVTHRLAEATSAQLTTESGQDRWAILLDALAFAPVRLAVKPQSFPAKASDELLAVVRKLSSRLPDIAQAFGIEPQAEAARSRGPRRPPGKARPAPAPRPPRPPRQTHKAPEAAVEPATPEPEATGPEPERTEPGPEAAEPERTEPEPEAAAPGPEAAEPERTEPGPEAAEPELERTEPEPEVTELAPEPNPASA